MANPLLFPWPLQCGGSFGSGCPVAAVALGARTVGRLDAGCAYRLVCGRNNPHASNLFYKLFRERGLIAVERLMGMLLVTLSVQMLLDGFKTYLDR